MDTELTKAIVAGIFAFLASSTGLAFGKRIWARFTGKDAALRGEIDRAHEQVKAAEAKVTLAEAALDRVEHARDQERTARRISQEHASEVRRIAIDAGVPASEIPPYPSSALTMGPLSKE
ncbi:hypothetical protein [Pseudoclavibacter terrae]|uniref:Uncharacterized protein n=1 Tax=Pseudoclavibacter terrae TaxID=1530195 RepID=A0A7J5B8B7_9MICO|nr:hypothetical protein [Pseudoclavibacter terrae]KAB1639881.1 hypothetical protein F8O03_06110 [Pseudoclavibacter terrae]